MKKITSSHILIKLFKTNEKECLHSTKEKKDTFNKNKNKNYSRILIRNDASQKKVKQQY